MIRNALLFTLSCLLALPSLDAASKVKALIVDGQNNHQWQQTTPVLKQILEEAGFQVDVATTPSKGQDMSGFKPNFAAYKVVVSNFNTDAGGDQWPPETKAAFEKFVREGGGFVSYHAADNAFPEWKEYNQMIAVGGWGKRSSPDSGSLIRYRDGKAVLEKPPVRCGNHGQRLPFKVTMRDPNHPIAKGLPAVWMHTADELYDKLCGPAENFTVVSTAHSEPSNKGTGEEEPMLLTIQYGKGRVFHTTLGHDVAAMKCQGFVTTFQRGTEWAASGKVKTKVPKNFPTADQPSTVQ